MNYIEVHINCSEEIKEILIAELDNIQADSISETEKGLLASFTDKFFEEITLKELSGRYGFDFTHNVAEKINWNEEWEKNFHQLQVEKLFN